MLCLCAACFSDESSTTGYQQDSEITYFFKQSLNGISLGAIYAFIALGYTMVYGIVRLINFAHGEFFMAGAFAGYFALNYLCIEKLNLPYPIPIIISLLVTLLIAALTSATLAVTVERIAYRPIRRAGRISALLTALGVSLFLQNFGVQMFSAEMKAYPECRRWYSLSEVKEGMVFNNQPYIQYITTSVTGKSDISKEFVSKADEPLTAQAMEHLQNTYIVTNIKPIPQSESSNAGSVVKQKRDFLSYKGVVDETICSVLVPMCDYSQSVANLNDSQLSQIKSVADYYQTEHIDGFFVESPISEKGKKWLVIILLAVCTLGLSLFVKYTKRGKAMRAVSQDIEASKLMGINANRIIMLTFFIGAFLAGIGGVIFGMRYGKVWPYMGFMPGLKAFVAAVLGGIGSIPGAVIGGLILGFSEIMVQAYGLSGYRDAVAFGILIIILVVRPRGILGAAEGQKV
ncbi:MAG: branched-chain amino acid ABC transporter permease [Planctomycetota bacterium]